MTVCACARLRQCCGHLHLLEKGMISSDSGMEDIGLEDIGLQSAMEVMTLSESNPIEPVVSKSKLCLPALVYPTLILHRLIYQLSTHQQL